MGLGITTIEIIGQCEKKINVCSMPDRNLLLIIIFVLHIRKHRMTHTTHTDAQAGGGRPNAACLYSV